MSLLYQKSLIGLKTICLNLINSMKSIFLHVIAKVLEAFSNAVKSNCCSSEIIDMLPDIKEKIFNTLRGYNEKADVDDNHFKKSIYANTMALLAITYIDDATGDFSSDYRYRLFQNILSNPEIPFPNKVTWYHPVRAKEFTHWLLPWAIGALSKQPFTDSFMLINMCKQIMNHYNEKKGVELDKNGRYHLWAAGHMLYALLNTLEFFGYLHFMKGILKMEILFS